MCLAWCCGEHTLTLTLVGRRSARYGDWNAAVRNSLSQQYRRRMAIRLLRVRLVSSYRVFFIAQPCSRSLAATTLILADLWPLFIIYTLYISLYLYSSEDRKLKNRNKKNCVNQNDASYADRHIYSCKFFQLNLQILKFRFISLSKKCLLYFRKISVKSLLY